ncbi:MAG: hypothetical protein MJD61_18385 [Proteobacteria bacterium]|nr:hypothetical protein [Pseudomonadota bacterium]
MRNVQRVRLHQQNKLTALGPDAFLGLNSTTKARLVRFGQVSFLDSAGRQLPLSEAVESLYRRWRAARRDERPARPRMARPPLRLKALPGGAGATTARAEGERHESGEWQVQRNPVQGLPLCIVGENEGVRHVGILQRLLPGGLTFRSRGRYRPGERLLLGLCEGERDHETWVEVRVDESSASEASGRSAFACSATVRFLKPSGRVINDTGAAAPPAKASADQSQAA